MIESPLEDYSWWAEINSRLSQGETLPREVIKEAVYKWLTYIADPNYLSPAVGFWATLTSKMNMKGYTEDEIAGITDGVEATKTFHFQIKRERPIVDISGGGGDTFKTFNISSTASMVAAAAGAISPKMAGPSLTSVTGSGNLAEAMGFNLEVSKETITECINEFGFAYAGLLEQYPWNNPVTGTGSFKPKPYAPTIFCFLNPFRMGVIGINAFDVKRMVRGYSDPDTEIIAKILAKTGGERVLIPCGYGPIPDIRFDEFSIAGKTKVSELREGKIKTYEIVPEDVGLRTHSLEEIASGRTHEENAAHVVNAISGQDRGGRRDAAILNAAAILYLSDIAADLKEGVKLAAKVIDEGRVVALIEKVMERTGGNIKRFRSYL